MLPSESPEPQATPAVAPPSLSPLQRAIAIFVRPAGAWDGLADRSQWWIPFLVVTLVTLLGIGLTFRRAQVPTILESFEERVASGQMTDEQLQTYRQVYESPSAFWWSFGVATVLFAGLPFLAAGVIQFAVGFVLGAPFRYRHGLETAAWSSLIILPTEFLTFSLGWIRQSMNGIHTGFGILLPEAGHGDKLMQVVAWFLDDWIGPFRIWRVGVAVLGAAYFSSAPRKPVAWALSLTYLVTGLAFGGLWLILPFGP